MLFLIEMTLKNMLKARKVKIILVLVAIIVVGLSIYSYALSNVKIKFTIEDISYVDATAEYTFFNVKIKATNPAPFKVITQHSKLTVFYKGGEIGTVEIPEGITFDAGESKLINVILKIPNLKDLSDMFNDLLNNGHIFLKAEGPLSVKTHIILEIPVTISVSEDVEFKLPLWPPISAEIVNVTHVEHDGSVVLRSVVKVRNNVNISFSVLSASIYVKYHGNVIGEARLRSFIKLQASSTMISPIELITDPGYSVSIGNLLSNILSNESAQVELKGSARVAIGEYLRFNVELKDIPVNVSSTFKVSLSAQLLDTEILPPGNRANLKLKVNINAFNPFKVPFNVTQISLTVYNESMHKIADVKIPYSRNWIIGNVSLIVNSQVEITQDSLKWIINKVVENEPCQFIISNISANIQVYSIPVQVTTNRLFTTSMSFDFTINPRIEITNLTVLPPGNVFQVTLNVFPGLPDPYNVKLTIDEISFSLYWRSSLIKRETIPANIVKEKGQRSFPLTSTIELQSETAVEIIKAGLEEGYVTLRIDDITVKIHLYEVELEVDIPSSIEYSLSFEYRVEVESIDAIILTGDTLTTILKVNIEIPEAYNIEALIANISFDIYSGGEKILRANASDIVIQHGGCSLVQVSMCSKISDEILSKLLTKILEGEEVRFAAMNVSFTLTIYDLRVDLTIPGNFSIKYGISYIGTRVIDACEIDQPRVFKITLQVNVIGFQGVATISSFKAEVYNVSDFKIARVWRHKPFTYDSNKVENIFEVYMEPTPESLGDAVSKLFFQNPIEVKLKNATFTFQVEDRVFSVKIPETGRITVTSDISAKIKIGVADVVILDPGTRIKVNATVTLIPSKELNVEALLKTASFTICYQYAERELEHVNLILNERIRFRETTITVSFIMTITQEDAQDMANSLINHGKATFVVKDIIVLCSSNEVDFVVKVPDQTYTYKIPPFSVEVLNIEIAYINVSPPKVRLVVEVELTNPTSFSVVLRSLEFDAYCHEHGTYLGHGNWSGYLTVPAKSSVALTVIFDLTASGALHVVLYHQTENGWGLYVDVRNGVGVLQIYSLQVTVSFSKDKIWAEYP